jgi:hypothetical protein
MTVWSLPSVTCGLEWPPEAGFAPMMSIGRLLQILPAGFRGLNSVQ